MTLTETRNALRRLLPKLSEGRDYVLSEDGAISAWKISAKRFPQPTPEQLQAALTSAAQASRNAEIDAARQARIDAVFGSKDAELAALRKGLAITRKRTLGTALSDAEAALETQLVAVNAYIESLTAYAATLKADATITTPAWPAWPPPNA